MCRFHPGRLVLTFLFLCIFIFSGFGYSAERALVSTMRNVNAVMEAQGFRINPAFEHSGFTVEGELAPVQTFEIMRPDGKAFNIGRLYTSCTCIQLESPKRSFAQGERALLQLHNIRPTPVNGQIYAIYVQITSPVRTTLRFDTFVQSDNPELMAAAEGTEPATDSVVSSDLEEVTPPPAVADASENEAEVAEAQPSTDQRFQVIVPDEESEQSESEATVEVAEAEAEGEEQPSGEPVETAVLNEREAIAAEADARVRAASDAVDSMAADMDGYFAEVDSSIPEALPPPEEPEKLPPVSGGGDAGPAEAASVGVGKPIRGISLITIGVRDLDRSIRFYSSLGWELAPRGKYEQTAFFQLNGQVLVLYPLTGLLREQNMEEAKPVPGGITLAIHVGSKEEVFEVYGMFVAAGGVVLKEPEETIAGSVTGYIADPDGNAWEISHVSQFKMDADGGLWLNQQ